MRKALYLLPLGLLAVLIGCGGASGTSTSSNTPSYNANLTKINSNYMLTPQEAYNWAYYKAQLGPTYAGNDGWKKYYSFIKTTAQSYGLVDLDELPIPYQFYTVNDWPDKGTHTGGSGREIEKLVSNGTVVPVVASYGMTSGSTGPTGVTAQMIYYDPNNPPTAAQIKGKIMVVKTTPYTAAAANTFGPYSYTSSFLDSYAMTDYEYRTDGNWYQMFQPVPASVASGYWYRWTWNQLGTYASAAMKAGAAGMVVVYDLSPDGALGVTQRSVYTLSGKPTDAYVNVPTLCLDRVNGAQVLVDAQNGKTATLTLTATFNSVTGTALVGYLPGKNYGTSQDQQVMIVTHTDAMSLVEEDGGLGLLAVLKYFSQVPQSDRPRTLVFFWDSRHFMPGGESGWNNYDYYVVYPDKLKKIVADVAMEHMGGRQTIETGASGNTYQFSTSAPNSGGYITSFIDIYNNNPWLIQTVKQAALDNNWPRVDAKVGPVQPGSNGGYQTTVKSPLNKGRTYGFAGIGLAGDWPGCCTQTFAGIETFDENYFVTQVAGLSQIVGNLMLVDTRLIDLGWGQLKSGLVCTSSVYCSTAPSTGLLPDSAFVSPADASTLRANLLTIYNNMFTALQNGDYPGAKTQLQSLETAVKSSVSDPSKLSALIEAQIAKLP